jgi:hypothetical protein
LGRRKRNIIRERAKKISNVREGREKGIERK